jgi:hypothetical protein
LPRRSKIPVHLVYYPPYHTKYNPIEHSFGVLERYWNGAILNSVDAVLGYASNMTLNKKKPLVKLIDKVYEKGVTLSKKELRPFLNSFVRSANLKYWDVVVNPVKEGYI